MKVLRTPDARFDNLVDYPFPPRYTDLGGLRMHHVELGPSSGAPVLLLHGEPTWSYLYRHMLPVIAAAGHRAIAPDFIGCGRSDKPASRRDYSYAAHVDWTAAWIEANGLTGITLVCQDWGSLIGLRVVAEHPERFARVVVANGFLPTGDRPLPLAFKLWQAFARFSPVFPVRAIVRAGCARKPSREALRGYAAPFPSGRYKAAVRAFPRIVPSSPNDPAAPANRRAWEVLRQWQKPFLTAFAANDAIFRGFDRILQQRIPGAHGQSHQVLRGAGHFIQEDAGPELAEIVVKFMGKK
ncbi:MAG TPA: haloalkane dehalogenase [Thermoanaerobaculia bacterium]|nr:haloalkane dehalogenase [Thermoanaerobaculia bacterium]